MRKHRRLRRKRNRKQTHLVIGMTLALLFVFIAGYAAFGTNISITAKGNLTTEETCTLNHEWTYDYENNKIYDLKIPCNGTYKLETWGAQGGDALTLEGGYGGYSVGNINLKRNQNLYIVVGGKGQSTINLPLASSNYYNYLEGGYNGGGFATNGRCASEDYRYSGGGGGATHVSTETGLLSSLENSKESIIIVSAGGGGAYANTSDETTIAGTNGSGAAGGGFNGGNATATKISGKYPTVLAKGGTQYNGGLGGNPYSGNTYLIASFGKGGGAHHGACDELAGGGSGYYGGGGGKFSPGAGGSSYINNDNLKNKHMTCYKCTETTDSDPDGIKTFSNDKVDENPKVDTAKKGNGYAKITLISIG